MDRLHEVERAEREANEALYAVDPELARELGYVPPSPGPFAHQLAESMRGVQQRYTGRELAQHSNSLSQLLEEQSLAAQQQNLTGIGGLGSILGSALAGALGGAVGGALGGEVGRRHFPPRYR